MYAQTKKHIMLSFYLQTRYINNVLQYYQQFMQALIIPLTKFAWDKTMVTSHDSQPMDLKTP